MKVDLEPNNTSVRIASFRQLTAIRQVLPPVTILSNIRPKPPATTNVAVSQVYT